MAFKLAELLKEILLKKTKSIVSNDMHFHLNFQAKIILCFIQKCLERCQYRVWRFFSNEKYAMLKIKNMQEYNTI